MKISDIHQTRHDEDDDDAIDLENLEDEDDLDEDPIVEWREIPVYGAVNRVRCMPPSLSLSLSNDFSLFLRSAAEAEYHRRME